jgi:hypothetical protein
MQRAGLRKNTKAGVRGRHSHQRIHVSLIPQPDFQRSVHQVVSRRPIRAHLRSDL